MKCKKSLKNFGTNLGNALVNPSHLISYILKKDEFVEEKFLTVLVETASQVDEAKSILEVDSELRDTSTESVEFSKKAIKANDDDVFISGEVVNTDGGL